MDESEGEGDSAHMGGIMCSIAAAGTKEWCKQEVMYVRGHDMIKIYVYYQWANLLGDGDGCS